MTASPVAERGRTLPVVQKLLERQVPSLGQEDPLEEGRATRSRILVWRIPWREEPGGLQSMGCKASDKTEAAGTHAHMSPPS